MKTTADDLRNCKKRRRQDREPGEELERTITKRRDESMKLHKIMTHLTERKARSHQKEKKPRRKKPLKLRLGRPFSINQMAMVVFLRFGTSLKRTTTGTLRTKSFCAWASKMELNGTSSRDGAREATRSKVTFTTGANRRCSRKNSNCG